MTPPTPPRREHERDVLERAMTECRRRLDYFREEEDDLNGDLAEVDLNLMLERWAQLATEDTDAPRPK